MAVGQLSMDVVVMVIVDIPEQHHSVIMYQITILGIHQLISINILEMMR